VHESELAEVIRDKIGLGRLPRKAPAKTYIGPGTGARCDACGLVVEPANTEYEFDVDATALRMHRECFKVWTAEVEKLA
jgi:hypothetical protein